MEREEVGKVMPGARLSRGQGCRTRAGRVPRAVITPVERRWVPSGFQEISSHDGLVLAVVPHPLQRMTPGSLAEAMQLPGRASAQVWVQSSRPACQLQ